MGGKVCEEVGQADVGVVGLSCEEEVGLENIKIGLVVLDEGGVVGLEEVEVMG